MKTILIVDDDADQVELLGMVFEDKYHVLRATSMQEAVRTFKKNPQIDAIITDFFLGDGTGLTLIDTIKPGPSIATILVTGHHFDVQVNERYKDFDAYFIKPTDFKMLTASLSTALRVKAKK